MQHCSQAASSPSVFLLLLQGLIAMDKDWWLAPSSSGVWESTLIVIHVPVLPTIFIFQPLGHVNLNLREMLEKCHGSSLDQQALPVGSFDAIQWQLCKWFCCTGWNKEPGA
jgi:hypothetical protein